MAGDGVEPGDDIRGAGTETDSNPDGAEDDFNMSVWVTGTQEVVVGDREQGRMGAGTWYQGG